MAQLFFGIAITENEELFAERISLVYVLPLASFLKDGDLHLLLVDLVTKEDDLLVFVIGIHFRKSFQASLIPTFLEFSAKYVALTLFIVAMKSQKK